MIVSDPIECGVIVSGPIECAVILSGPVECGVIVSDREASTTRSPWPTGGCRAKKN